MVGSTLRKHLSGKYHTLTRLVRPDSSHRTSSDIPWDPYKPFTNPSVLEGFDAVIHLAGESIAAGRWTDKKKEEIRDSRVLGSRHLADALLKVEKKPKMFISASAVGYYGNRGSEGLTEYSTPGTGFLPDVCKEWEQAAAPLAQSIHVTWLRFGIILSTKGGALQKMLPAFKMGVAGRLGSGRQFMSWVDLEDVVGIIEFVLGRERGMGPVNATAPYPVTNKEFTETLGRVLSRPTALPMPEFAARLAFGEMADALLLASAKVIPEKLVSADYPYKFPTLESSLRHQLKSA